VSSKIISSKSKRKILRLKPAEFLDTGGKIKICAWCQEEKGVQPQRGESHSICPLHSELLRRAGLKLAEVK